MYPMIRRIQSAHKIALLVTLSEDQCVKEVLLQGDSSFSFPPNFVTTVFTNLFLSSKVSNTYIGMHLNNSLVEVGTNYNVVALND